MRQQAGAGHATRDRAAGRCSLEDALALRARELRTNGADDLEARGHVLQMLRDVRTDAPQPATATCAAAILARGILMCGCGVGAQLLLLAGKVIRQAAIQRAGIGGSPRRARQGSSWSAAGSRRLTWASLNRSLEAPYCACNRRVSCKVSLSTISLSADTSATRSRRCCLSRFASSGRSLIGSKALGTEQHCARSADGCHQPSCEAPRLCSKLRVLRAHWHAPVNAFEQHRQLRGSQNGSAIAGLGPSLPTGSKTPQGVPR